MAPSPPAISSSVTPIAILCLFGAIAAIFVLTLIEFVGTQSSMYVLLFVGLSAFALLLGAAQRDETSLLLRPPVLVLIASGIGALAGLTLPSQYQAEFLKLHFVEAAGFIVGAIVGSLPGRPGFTSYTSSVRPELKILRIVSIAAAMIFFAWQGVPVLAGNVESARVAAAVSGSGYLRLLSYMTIPAALVAVALRAPKYRWHVFIAVVIVFGLANRSPLVYLFIPMALSSSLVARSQRRSQRRLLAGLILVAVLAVGLGTFRIATQSEFRQYSEYSQPLADGDYLEVASISVGHYVEVVAENAILTKHLVDSGALEHTFGATYFSAVTTALPGEQLTLDRQIKLASGATFIGGGTPPTLAGEGYVNFGWIGTFGVPLYMSMVLSSTYKRFKRARKGDEVSVRLLATVYAYLVTLACGSQVAGLAGASTFPLTGLVVLVLLVSLQRDDRKSRGMS